MFNGLNVSCSFVTFVLGVVTGIAVQTYDLHRVAVRNGCGQYNSKTGDFEWISHKEPEPDYVTEVHNQMIMNRLNNQKCE